jgi:hypothetical protein
MAEGWIRIYRKSFENEMYFSEKFTRWQAWMDLVLLANHKDSIARVRGVRIEVKRGQVCRSIKVLAARWKWSQGKVSRFLNELQIDAQIDAQKTNVITLISILNYDRYQQDKTKTGSKRGANGEQIDAQTETYKNDKNIKNDKNEKKVLVNGEKSEESPAAILRRLQSIQLEQIRIRTTGVNFESELNKWSDHVIFNQQEDRPPKALLAGFRRWLRQAEEWNQQGRNKNQNNIERQSDGF